MIGGKHYDNQYEALCECWDEGDARRIVAALNTDSIPDAR
jgi:hypothetical protein